jgi:hypothetical protein
MITLLMKDVRSTAPVLVVFILLYGLVGLPAARSDEAFFWLTVKLAVGLWVIPPVLDWRNEADRFLCSLPVDRSAFVWARGVWVLLATAAAGGLWVVSGHLWFGVLAGDRWRMPAVPIWTTLDGVLGFAVVTMVLASVFLPCYFRFGIGKGSAAAAALAIVPLLTVSALLEGTGPAGEFGGRLQAAALQQAMRGLRDRAGTFGLLVIVGVGATIAATISLRLAKRFYEQREF